MNKLNKNIKEMFLKEDLTSVIYTGRGGGKSIFLTTLLILTRDIYDVIFFFTSTFEQNKKSYDIFNLEDKQFIIINVNEINIVKTMKKVYNEIKQKNNSSNKKEHLKTLFIFDDIFTSENMTMFKKQKENPVLDIFNNGRHYTITVLILSQDLKYISRSMRKNTDIFVTFNISTLDEKEELLTTLNMFKTKKEFEEVIFSLKEYEPLMLIRRTGEKYLGGNVIINFDKIINTKKK